MRQQRIITEAKQNKYVIEYNFVKEESARYHSTVNAKDKEEAVEIAQKSGPERKPKDKIPKYILQATNYNDSNDSTWPADIIKARNSRHNESINEASKKSKGARRAMRKGARPSSSDPDFHVSNFVAPQMEPSTMATIVADVLEDYLRIRLKEFKSNWSSTIEELGIEFEASYSSAYQQDPEWKAHGRLKVSKTEYDKKDVAKAVKEIKYRMNRNNY